MNSKREKEDIRVSDGLGSIIHEQKNHWLAGQGQTERGKSVKDVLFNRGGGNAIPRIEEEVKMQNVVEVPDDVMDFSSLYSKSLVGEPLI
ncbi:hypothetical protein L1987_29794 [Smallanthus sonchifolius]|uniref:Uncharacterized protein n=1 Tax=Smallanthus sonchifolius TaxID=185202 RepID=A0ACB9I0W3_9ASTR|nr:hypothetical protein L1987_29794 [Smallanthus sonchifolius]